MYQYNPGDITVTLVGEAGTHIVSGYAPDTFVRASRTERNFTGTRTSADGKVTTRNRRNNKQGEVTLTLEEASPSNAWLDDLMGRDENDLTGIVSISITDANGNEKVFSPQAWIMGPPDIEKGAEAGTRAWVFDCGQLDIEARGATQI